jgi:nitronate monooxygenase
MRPSPLSLNPTEFARQLGALYPVIQAPMAGGITTPALVAAVSRAGALGSLAGGMLAPAALRKHIADIRALGCQDFSVNLFVLDEPQAPAPVVSAALRRLDAHYAALGVPATVPERFCESTELQLNVLIETPVPLASFAFGLLHRTQVAELHRVGTRVVGTATTVAEAVAWADAGADAVCAQGFEAGGHRGGFVANLGHEQLGTLALVPLIRAAVGIPVIAAGGIMNGAGIAACLALGASAAQLGTAFLCCEEAGTHPLWKRKLLEEPALETGLTVAFSGRPARGLRNRFMDEMAPFAGDIPPYPIQNALTAPLRARAGQVGDTDHMSLWAGQAHALVRSAPAARIVQQLVAEAGAAAKAVADACAWAGPPQGG